MTPTALNLLFLLLHVLQYYGSFMFGPKSNHYCSMVAGPNLLSLVFYFCPLPPSKPDAVSAKGTNDPITVRSESMDYTRKTLTAGLKWGETQRQ